VAAALGVPAEGRRPLLDVVAERLAGRHALIVIDNAEQVLGAAPRAAALLARCPRTQLLVTSRSVLGLRGEQDVPLEPLPVPAPGETDPGRIRQSPAVALFAARARRSDPGSTLRDADLPVVAEVVRRLDGLPLALELAAARSRTLPPAALLRRLGTAVRGVLDLRGTEVDAPDRQRTLRDTVAWSHELLTDAERALLARLSVCSGGCTLDTAEAIGAVDDDVDVLETLAALVGHSLVTPADTGEGEPRFRMLELVRAFADERLTERGEAGTTRQRLAEHLAGVSAAAGPSLTGPDQASWRARLDAEAPDLLAALRWAVAADRADLAVAIAAPLARWWWSRGLLGEMAELADATAGLPSAAALPPAPAALLHWARGATRIALGRVDEAAPLLTRQVELARTADDPWLLGHGLVALAMTRPPDDPDLAGRLAAGVAALRRSGDAWSVAYALIPLGDVALLAGDLPSAVSAHEEALGLARGIDDDHLVAAVLDQLGFDALMAGDTPGARARLVEAAGLHRGIRDLEGLANCLSGLAALTLASGAPQAAARLAGAAAAARTEVGVTVWPLLQILSAQLDAALQAALGSDDDRRERAAGAAADPWAALDEGLAAVG
jgi:predicted ATPase